MIYVLVLLFLALPIAWILWRQRAQIRNGTYTPREFVDDLVEASREHVIEPRHLADFWPFVRGLLIGVMAFGLVLFVARSV